MYIKKLTIKNFRTFDEEGVTLQFNKGVNAIIGENNSGKSAVMDAIRIAFSTVTYKKDIFFTNKQLREQIQLLHRDIAVHENNLFGYETKLRAIEKENAEIKSSFWYKVFGKK